jgi:hypothetical protein
MGGIPGVLYKDLRAVLLECGPFGDQDRERLEAVFDDHQLRPWRYTIPEGRNALTRVEALITFLYNKPFDKPNPLLRLVRILTDRSLEPGCTRELTRVCAQLAQHFGEPHLAPAVGIEHEPDARRLETRKTLHIALLDAFPTRRELDRMVALEMGENLNAIASDSNLQQTVFELVGWAERQGRMTELVRGARRQNSGNRKLAEVAPLLGAE